MIKFAAFVFLLLGIVRRVVVLVAQQMPPPHHSKKPLLCVAYIDFLINRLLLDNHDHYLDSLLLLKENMVHVSDQDCDWAILNNPKKASLSTINKEDIENRIRYEK